MQRAQIRASRHGKAIQKDTEEVGSEQSSDSYDSVVDGLYKPGDSDSSDDDGLFFGSASNVAKMYDTYDGYHDNSDGGDSWHSLEMKTAPNSEDELEEVESHDVLPVFKEGARFEEI
ncbi:hypothetical protein PIB30_065581 [Stylosanthes scabra]|uniref:Uncharacterized protein n=1 Tax=Stylosanthes scabra TaxID=79078 RepID=A0ABU6VLV4_9FABA|nr:hypothetical protein [Stylosanthes scabra]